MEKDTRSEYRQIVKATSIFGGVQVITILVTIIRSKAVALLLGPSGMGVNTILNETLNLIRTLTGVGLQTSAIKSISNAAATNDQKKIGQVVRVFRGWTWITGLLGFLITLLFAPFLSRWAFGNDSFTYSFLIISFTILFTQIGAGYSVVFQGLRRVGILAKTAVWGAVAGLITSVPLYFWFGNKGIEPAIIISSISTLVIAWFFSSTIKVEKVRISWSQFLGVGRSMLLLGFLLSLSGLITMASNYLLRIYISREAGVEEVGLFAAGFTILNSYVGLVFTALATDYFPKLSLIVEDLVKRNNVINSQAEIAILIISPILCFFICFIDWAIIALYSERFLKINRMLQWGALGMFFKTASWALGYLLIAKGKSKIYFLNELFANIYLFFLSLAGYTFFGLTGLGISLAVGYFIYLIQNLFVVTHFYRFKFSSLFIRLFFIQVCIGCLCLVASTLISGILGKLLGTLFAFGSVYFSLVELDNRINIRSVVKQFHSRILKNK